jgi:hypothetical protein
VPVLVLPNAAPQIISTDYTRREFLIGRPHDKFLKVIRLNEKLAEAGTPWVVATYNQQPYAFSGDDQSVILATPGSVFAVTGDHQITVKEGNVVVAAGNSDVQIRTPKGTVMVAHDSSAGVTQDHFGGVRVASLQGAPAYFDVNSGSSAQVANTGRSLNAPVSVANAGNSNNPGGQRIEIGANNEMSLVSSQIAAAGVSDFVPLLEAGISENVRGMKVANHKLDLSQTAFGSQFANVDRTDMSNAQMATLNRVITGLEQSGQKLPESTDKGMLDPDNRVTFPAVIPIAHVETIPATRPAMKHEFTTLQGNKCVRTIGSDVMQTPDGKILVNSGELLIDATKQATVVVGNYTLELRKGTTALISRNANRIKIFNLSDTAFDSIAVKTKRGEIATSAGQELTLAANIGTITSELKQDGIARRRLHIMDCNGSMAAMSEFSIVSLFQKNSSLKFVYGKDEKDAKAISEKIMKMGVVIQQVTQSRGAYKQVASVPSNNM